MEKTKESVEQSLALIERMRLEGDLSDDLYFKCVVSIAYDFLSIGENELAFGLLVIPSAEYYEKEQLVQMEKDAMYGNLCVSLAYKLVQMGVAMGVDEIFRPNMKGGLA